MLLYRCGSFHQLQLEIKQITISLIMRKIQKKDLDKLIGRSMTPSLPTSAMSKKKSRLEGGKIVPLKKTQENQRTKKTQTKVVGHVRTVSNSPFERRQQQRRRSEGKGKQCPIFKNYINYIKATSKAQKSQTEETHRRERTTSREKDKQMTQSNTQALLNFQHAPGSQFRMRTKVKLRPKKGQQNRFQVLGELGRGSYAIVKLAIDSKTQNKVAIKIYDKQLADFSAISKQVQILRQVNHPNISMLIGVRECPTQMQIIMEYGGANSLFKYLISRKNQCIQESQAKKFFNKIVGAVEYLHRNGISHRDIKAENVLLNRHKEIKLIDFGFSVKSSNLINNFCGTPTYMSPEIVKRQPYNPIAADLWAMGVLFYVMLQGNYPFRAQKQDVLFEKIQSGSFRFINECSQRAKQLICSMIKINPKERLTTQQLMQAGWQDWLQQRSSL